MARTFDSGEFDVGAREGVVLIEANAGTGKTYTIQQVYRRLIESGLKVSEILVVTFTEAATAELRERIRAELALGTDTLAGGVRGQGLGGSDGNASGGNDSASNGYPLAPNPYPLLKLAVASFDEAAIFTIHGFCKRTLDRFAFEGRTAFECRVDEASGRFREEAVLDFYRSRLTAAACPAVSLERMQEFAKKALGVPNPKILHAEYPPIEAMMRGVREEVRRTALPKRDSAFKAALVAAKSLAEEGTDEALQALLLGGDLSGDTARRNAPELARRIDELIEAREVALLLELHAFLNDGERGVQARKARARVMGFDDVLLNVHRAMVEGGGEDSPLARMFRETYKVALVDEFQDTDSIQYEIFSMAFGRHGTRLFMIGDPKQAIYGFRGGDIFTYLRAKRSVPDEHRYTLTQNFRSSERLIGAINGLFGHEGIFLEEDIAYSPSSFGVKGRDVLVKNGNPLEKPVKVVWYAGKEDGTAESKGNAEKLLLEEGARQILAMLNDEEMGVQEFRSSGVQKDAGQGTTPPFGHPSAGGELLTPSPYPLAPVLRRIAPQDFAVLVNTHRECLFLQGRLRAMNIPAIVYKSGNVFHSREARELFYILRAVLHPLRAEAVRTALQTAWCGWTHEEIVALRNVAATSPSPSLGTVCEKLRHVRGVWVKSGIVRAVAEFEQAFMVAATSSSPSLNISDGGGAASATFERSLVNWRHLQELLYQEERENGADPVALLSWLRQRIKEEGCQNEAYEERLESDRDAVKIMTLHHSKGLQFPIVVCPAVSLRDDGAVDPEKHFDTVQGEEGTVLPLGSMVDEYREKMRHEQMAEAMRKLYVAMTRAVNALIVVGGNVWKKGYDNAFNLLGKFQKIRDQRPETRDLLEAPGAVCTFEGEYIEVESLNRHSSVVTRYSNDEGRMTNDDESTLGTLPFISDTFAIMSYTGMARHEIVAATSSSPSSEFNDGDEDVAATMPRGRTVGIALHEIFEGLDFTKGADARVVGEILKKYALAEKDVQERIRWVREMADRVLTATLPGAEIALSVLAPSKTVREWAFYFPVPRYVDVKSFEEIGLRFSDDAGRKTGFMTGSIDVIFQQGEKYYFADWKSDTLSDYSAEALEKVMTERAYQFQAIVYSVALYTWLRLRLGKSFDYEKHFGGGYYLFLRGMTEGKGVYPFRPSESDIRRYVSNFHVGNYE